MSGRHPGINSLHGCEEKKIPNSTLDTTIDEWRAEMERTEAGDPGKTVIELARDFNLARSTMQGRLNKLIEAGRCIRGTGKRFGSGGVYPVSVYQLTPEKKEG